MVLGRNSANFEDVNDLGHKLGYDLGFRQLSPGPACVDATMLSGELTTIVHMKFDHAYHQLGMPPPGQTTVGVPINSIRNWYGNQYEESSVLPFNVPGGIDGVSEAGFRSCVLSIQNDDLRRVSEAFGIPVDDALVSPCTDSAIRNSSPTQLLRRMLLEDFEDETRQLDRGREEEIIGALLYASSSESARIDKSSPGSRFNAVSKALLCVEEHENEAITVADICSYTGITLRTLNRAFRERFGVGPKAYLVRRRLNAVRLELANAPGNTLIADVANRHGFWHLGQFAKDYNKLFHELPSQTMKYAKTRYT